MPHQSSSRRVSKPLWRKALLILVCRILTRLEGTVADVAVQLTSLRRYELSEMTLLASGFEE